ncbi:Neurogenic locus notch 1 [Merluccius polli]|uniref:Neurogenic locus notch 1 n=1 Tax=Merluccius polli TaxID=89951 RepID=A0AA47N755_MERPO|nr:Neurogenic locus notch 1 [Merluccius polli]
MVEELRIVRTLVVRVLVVLGLCRLHQAAPSDAWGQCPVSRQCQEKFADGTCNKECSEPECLLDGFDCLRGSERSPCNPGHIQYCRDHYANSHCEQGCDNAPCGWDGSDCFRQTPVWAKGTLVVQVALPPQRANNSLLWELSVLLRTPLKLRGSAPLAPTRDLHALDPAQLAELLDKPTAADAGGSVLFLQVDNRPCSRLPSTCFLQAGEAAGFLRVVMKSQRPPELKAVIDVRGVRKEIGARDAEMVEKETKEAAEDSPAWLWVVIALAVGLALALTLAVFLAVRRFRRRGQRHRQCSEREDGGGGGARHRSTTASDTNGGGSGSGGDSKAWHQQQQHSGRQEHRSRSGKEKERNGLKKKKKAKEVEKKRRREPLGEDAMRMRPLKRDLDIGSDTDFTQSSMEDINARCSRRQQEASICDHRTQEQKHYRGAGHTQTPRPMQSPPRGWKRNAIPPPLLSPPQQTAPVHWCGPDGSVVLIRAVRSGLDRVVLELLRAGVPVNNTDHTGTTGFNVLIVFLVYT